MLKNSNETTVIQDNHAWLNNFQKEPNKKFMIGVWVETGWPFE
jgi:hypothetical protein